MPKMIERCIECAHYSQKSHKCMVCESKETDPRDPFFDDCPLPDAEPVRHGTWEEYPNSAYRRCTSCKKEFEKAKFSIVAPRCPICGAIMDGGARDER